MKLSGVITVYAMAAIAVLCTLFSAAFGSTSAQSESSIIEVNDNYSYTGVPLISWPILQPVVTSATELAFIGIDGGLYVIDMNSAITSHINEEYSYSHALQLSMTNTGALIGVSSDRSTIIATHPDGTGEWSFNIYDCPCKVPEGMKIDQYNHDSNSGITYVIIDGRTGSQPCIIISIDAAGLLHGYVNTTSDPLYMLSSPVVYEQGLVFIADMTWIVFTDSECKVVKRADIPKEAGEMLLGVTAIDSNMLAVISDYNRVYGVDSDGIIQWSVAGSKDAVILDQHSVVISDVLTISSMSGSMYAIDMQGDLLWELDDLEPITIPVDTSSASLTFINANRDIVEISKCGNINTICSLQVSESERILAPIASIDSIGYIVFSGLPKGSGTMHIIADLP